MSDGDSKGAGGTGVGAGRVLRRRTVEEWERIVQESFTSPLAVREVARRHGVSASQLSRRRSRARRDELVGALARRYAVGTRAEKTRILDEFQAVTGFHRKHAMARSALVRYPAPGGRKGRPAHLRRRGPRRAGNSLGGVGPDLRQAPEGADTDTGGGDGTARPSTARAGDPRRTAGHERGDHRPVTAQGPGAGGRPQSSAGGAAFVDSPEHPLLNASGSRWSRILWGAF